MPVTVGGTTITFNDGTTQSSSPLPVPNLTAGNFYYLGDGVWTGNGTSSPVGGSVGAITGTASGGASYNAIPGRFIVLKSGVIRCNFYIRYGTDIYGDWQAASFARVYINGVGVGSEVSQSYATYGVSTQDFSVNVNDVIQLYKKKLGDRFSRWIKGRFRNYCFNSSHNKEFCLMTAKKFLAEIDADGIIIDVIHLGTETPEVNYVEIDAEQQLAIWESGRNGDWRFQDNQLIYDPQPILEPTVEDSPAVKPKTPDVT